MIEIPLGPTVKDRDVVTYKLTMTPEGTAHVVAHKLSPIERELYHLKNWLRDRAARLLS